MKISHWSNLTGAERENALCRARGKRLSDTDLYPVSQEVCRLLRERLAGVAGCLDVEMGQNPETGEHTILVYINALNGESEEAVPDVFLEFPVRQMEIGTRRRRYREIWTLVLSNLLSWPDSKINEWIARTEGPSRKLIFYYRSAFFYVAPVVLDVLSGRKITDMLRVEAIRAIEEILSRHFGTEGVIRDNAAVRDELMRFIFALTHEQ